MTTRTTRSAVALLAVVAAAVNGEYLLASVNVFREAVA